MGILPTDKAGAGDVSTLATGAVVSLAGRIIGAGAVAALQIVLARSLGAERFGLFAIGWTILNIGSIVATVGLQNGVTRFGSVYWRNKPSALKGVVVVAIGLSLISGAVASAVLILTSPWLSASIFHQPGLRQLLVIFAFAFPLATGLKVCAAATRVSQRMEYGALSEDFGQAFVALVLVGLLLWAGYGLAGAVVGYVLSYALALILAAYFVVRVFSSFLKSRLSMEIHPGRLLAFSSVTVLANLFSILISRMDRLFIGHFMGAMDVGTYQALAQSSVVFLTVLGSLNAIFSPMIAEVYHNGQVRRLEELYRVSTRWGVYICLPIFLVFLLVPGQVMTVVFGQAYATGAGPLAMLSAAQLINVATGGVGFVLLMTGREKQWTAISGVAAALNIALSVVLIPRWGLMGAALASSVTVIGLYGAGLLLAKRQLGIWPYDRRYAKGLAAATLTALVILLLRAAYPAPSILGLGAIALTSIGVFTGLLLLFGLEAEDRELLGLLLSRRSRRVPKRET